MSRQMPKSASLHEAKICGSKQGMRKSSSSSGQDSDDSKSETTKLRSSVLRGGIDALTRRIVGTAGEEPTKNTAKKSPGLAHEKGEGLPSTSWAIANKNRQSLGKSLPEIVPAKKSRSSIGASDAAKRDKAASHHLNTMSTSKNAKENKGQTPRGNETYNREHKGCGKMSLCGVDDLVAQTVRTDRAPCDSFQRSRGRRPKRRTTEALEREDDASQMAGNRSGESTSQAFKEQDQLFKDGESVGNRAAVRLSASLGGRADAIDDRFIECGANTASTDAPHAQPLASASPKRAASCVMPEDHSIKKQRGRPRKKQWSETGSSSTISFPGGDGKSVPGPGLSKGLSSLSEDLGVKPDSSPVQLITSTPVQRSKLSRLRTAGDGLPASPDDGFKGGDCKNTLCNVSTANAGSDHSVVELTVIDRSSNQSLCNFSMTDKGKDQSLPETVGSDILRNQSMSEASATAVSRNQPLPETSVTCMNIQSLHPAALKGKTQLTESKEVDLRDPVCSQVEEVEETCESTVRQKPLQDVPKRGKTLPTKSKADKLDHIFSLEKEATVIHMDSPPRQRRQPPKKKSNGFAITDNYMDVTPRRRGQSPKKKSHDSAVTGDSVESPPRRRGRPPKKKSNNFAVTGDSGENFNSPDELTTNTHSKDQQPEFETNNNKGVAQESSSPTCQSVENTGDAKECHESQRSSCPGSTSTKKPGVGDIGVKRGRGRPPKRKKNTSYSQVDVPQSISVTGRMENPESHVTRRYETRVEAPSDFEAPTAEPKKKRGRPRKWPIKPSADGGSDLEDEARRLAAWAGQGEEAGKGKEAAESRDACEDTGKALGAAAFGEENLKRCGLCHETFSALAGIQKHYMRKHMRFWSKKKPEGEEPRSLGQLIKRLGYLVCNKCGRELASVSYYRHHYLWCGREHELTTCDYCGRTLKSMWLQSHTNIHLKQQRLEKEKQEKEAEEKKKAEAQEEGEEEELEETCSRPRRKAAHRAMDNIKQFTKEKSTPDNGKDDDFGDEAAEFDDVNASDRSAEFDTSSSEESTEASTVSEVSGDETASKSSTGKTAKAVKRYHFMKARKQDSSESKAPYFKRPEVQEMLTRVESKNWVSDWYLKAEKESLHPEWRPQRSHWQQLQPEEAARYLPESKESQAFKVKHKRAIVEEEQKLGLFKSCVHPKGCLFSVGGPVWSMAWCPLPLKVTGDQFLAVYCHPTHSMLHKIGKRSSEPALIQLWNCGHLGRSKKEKPYLCLALALDCGPVWSMRWCPTGVWERPDATPQAGCLPRLGLLALASNDGMVRIISIPHPDSIEQSGEHPPIYRVRATAVLKSCWADFDGYPLVSLDWQWRGDCTVLMAGDSGGRVVLWDVAGRSELVYCLGSSGIPEFVPYHAFYAHDFETTGVVFWNLTEHNIATCSRDRYVKIWDLRNTDVCVSSVQHSSHTGIVWPIRWPLVFASCDDWAVLGNNGAYCFDSGLFGGPMVNKIIPHNSTIWDLSFGDLASILASCDSMGTLSGTPVPVIQATQNHKSLRKNGFNLLQTSLEVRPEWEERLLKEKQHQVPGGHVAVRTGNAGSLDGSEAHKHPNGDVAVAADAVCSAEGKPGNEGASPGVAAEAKVGDQSQTLSRNSGSNASGKGTDGSNAKQAVRGKDMLTGKVLDQDLSIGELRDKYCLVYDLSPKPPAAEGRKVEDIRVFPLRALHKVALCPNFGAHKWTATGGQAGLVHLLFMSTCKDYWHLQPPAGHHQEVYTAMPRSARISKEVEGMATEHETLGPRTQRS